MQDTVDKILKENKLSLTEVRRKILELFLKADYALVAADIEKVLPTNIDRVTVYRTLQSFLQKGLIHLIPTTDNSIKYAFTKEDLKHKELQQNHVHFVCNNCNKTICLEDVTIPVVNLPQGYTAQFHELVITGTCVSCILRN
jgi:Fur family ferric uptake transcriptional regulator